MLRFEKRNLKPTCSSSSLISIILYKVSTFPGTVLYQSKCDFQWPSVKKEKPTTPVLPGASSCDRATPCSSFLFPHRSRVVGRPRRQGRGRKGGGELKGTLQVSLLPLGYSINSLLEKVLNRHEKITSTQSIKSICFPDQAKRQLLSNIEIVKIRKQFYQKTCLFLTKNDPTLANMNSTP